MPKSEKKLIHQIIAVFSRPYGRVYALRYRVASVCLICRRRLWPYVLWLNGASWSKSYYWQPIGNHTWEIDWYQNEWPWPLFIGRIKVMSTIASHLPLNISETVRDRGLVPKDYQLEIAYGVSNGHVTDDVTWQTRDANALMGQCLRTVGSLLL